MAHSRTAPILAICSKNNAEDVLEVLRNHPNMLLREEHFATMRINWTDKAENILSIARELNIEVDSLVFADNTHFECNRVRGALPEVDVLHLQGEPSSFKRQLSEAGLFDSLTFSDEDHKRTASYRAERQRKAIQATAASLDDYLLSLQIRAKIAPAESSQIPRVAQLTQKTNQFNLTTRRYTETDIQAFCCEPNKVVLCLWLADKMAEFGIVGVAINAIEEKVAHIDSFLLSCRARGREVEKALLACVVGHARVLGCETLLGYYRRTKKNDQVSDFYRKSGFQLVSEVDGGTDWTYTLTDADAPEVGVPAWIKLVMPE